MYPTTEMSGGYLDFFHREMRCDRSFGSFQQASGTL
jgi:hypothetical protein